MQICIMSMRRDVARVACIRIRGVCWLATPHLV
jgi:hypothetical protein